MGEHAVVVVTTGAIEVTKTKIEVLGLASHNPRTIHLRLLKGSFKESKIEGQDTHQGRSPGRGLN